MPTITHNTVALLDRLAARCAGRPSMGQALRFWVEELTGFDKSLFCDFTDFWFALDHAAMRRASAGGAQ